MNTYLIINETHSLLPDQIRELEEKGMSDYEEIRIPKEGWSLQTRLTNAEEWTLLGGRFIFVSPEPVLLGKLAYNAGFGLNIEVYIFTNDQRIKKELPDGRIVHTVAREGWKLVKVGNWSTSESGRPAK